MSAAQIQHVAVRTKILFHQRKECIFAIAGRDRRLPTMSETSCGDPWISQPAIHVMCSRIFRHLHLPFSTTLSYLCGERFTGQGFVAGVSVVSFPFLTFF